MEIQSQVQTFELMFQFTGKTTKKTHIPVHVSQNLKQTIIIKTATR